MDPGILMIILAMTAATFPSRFLPALFIKTISIDSDVADALRIVPFCILVSMIAMDVSGGAGIELQKLAAVAIVVMIGWWSESVGLSVVGGVIVYTLLDLGLGI